MEDCPGSFKRLRIYILETDRYRSGALYQAIVDKAKELKAISAVVFRAIEGYGISSELYQPSVWKLCQQMPLVTEVIGDEVAARGLQLFLDEAMSKGIVTVEDTGIQP